MSATAKFSPTVPALPPVLSPVIVAANAVFSIDCSDAEIVPDDTVDDFRLTLTVCLSDRSASRKLSVPAALSTAAEPVTPANSATASVTAPLVITGTSLVPVTITVSVCVTGPNSDCSV